MRRLSLWARGAASLSHLLLILSMLVAARGGSASLLVIPLLLPLAGILRGRSYTYSWASMVLAFYAAGYLSSGYADPAHKWSAFAMASLAAIDFVALVLYVRLLGRERLAGVAVSG